LHTSFIVRDEATFYIRGKVNRHNARVWGTENPHVTVEHERNSPKVNVFCAILKGEDLWTLFNGKTRYG
jgi:hypothetical protein